MTKHTLWVILLILLPNLCLSQTLGVFGKVVNEEKIPLEFVSVALLKTLDSTVINYTITDKKGEFKLNEPQKDSLFLHFSYMGYLSHFEKINSTTHDLKTIMLKEDFNKLDAITISAVIPVQVKKDTVSYNASSFKVNPDENLEELLKKLPGLEIDADGNISAHGNEVTKIFVDGKEFFSGDPGIVLKNLSADAIAKIEVIDKKSDEAEVTGVDDGNKQMVINFTLKKSNKNQGFGKLAAGLGLDSRYFTNLNYNRFSSKTQFSVIGKFNNINVTGSNIQGFLKNSDGLTDEQESDNSTQKNPKSLSGFLKTGVAGVHIGHEFKKKEDFSADYFYNLSDNRGTSQSKRISFTNTNNFDYISDNVYDRVSKNHNLNFNYTNKSNKSNALTIKGAMMSNESNSNLGVLGSYFTEAGALTTINEQTLNNKSNRESGNIGINFYQRLQKAGRNFSTEFNANISDRNRKNLQKTINNRKLDTDNPTTKEINTIRDETLKRGIYNFNFKYNEPLGGHNYIKLQSFSKSDIQNEDVYQLKNTITNDNDPELLAYKYKHIENSYKTRLAHAYTTGKLNLFNGVELQNYNRTFGVIDEPSVTKNLISLNPTSILLYKPKKGVKYKFIYKKLIRAPRSSQSSAVINDLNPFYIRKGNPDLEAEKMDDFLLMVNIFNYKSSLSFAGRFQYQYTKNAIVQNIVIDENFVKTRSFINSGNRKRLFSKISFGQKLKGLGLRYSIKNNNLYNTSNSIINLELNDVTSQDYLFGVSLENSNKNELDIKIGANLSLNYTSFSLEKDLNRTYKTQQYFAMFDYDITKKLSANTQFDYFVFLDNQIATDLTIPLWNAAISYNFSNNQNHILKLVLIDLLDKNVDIYRRSTTNFFEETTSESLGRYVILSYTFRLNGGKKKNNS